MFMNLQKSLFLFYYPAYRHVIYVLCSEQSRLGIDGKLWRKVYVLQSKVFPYKYYIRSVIAVLAILFTLFAGYYVGTHGKASLPGILHLASQTLGIKRKEDTILTCGMHHPSE